MHGLRELAHDAFGARNPKTRPDYQKEVCPSPALALAAAHEIFSNDITDLFAVLVHLIVQDHARPQLAHAARPLPNQLPSLLETGALWAVWWPPCVQRIEVVAERKRVCTCLAVHELHCTVQWYAFGGFDRRSRQSGFWWIPGGGGTSIARAIRSAFVRSGLVPFAVHLWNTKRQA